MAGFARGNLIFLWLALASAALTFVACSKATPERSVPTFGEINVQRINIVEPDGKPRVIISNRERMAKAYWHGKEYQHQSHAGGGFLFFNDDGTEAGGMGFSSGHDGDGYGATTNLNFDQYEQDNTLQLIYQDANGKRTAGLRVKDRPDASIFPAVQLVDEMARASDENERQRLNAKLQEVAKPLVEGTAVRFFAGKDLGDAVLKLSDKQGRPRLLLKVDGAGLGSIELMDEAGKVVKRITGNG